ncbi:unnamed protein product [Durusdinium trenchii]|uniref:Amidase domain-containing protein n=1 Tax=Durusdinium trenchii TaxID=1381693 RepID=A0ABP0MS92_9DINO
MLAVSKPSSRSLRKRLGQLGRLLLALYLLRKLPTILRRYWPTRPLKLSGPPFLQWSAVQLARAIQSRELTSSQVVEAYIQRLREVDVHLHCLVAERFDAAREEALAADQRIAQKHDERGALPEFLGVPILLKEAFEYPGFPYTNGLMCRKGRRGARPGPAVRRIEAAGFVVLGTGNVSEACMWMESYNLVYGRSRNPHGLHLSPGGSSGGTAALVAALGAPVALTADIGGSTRIPALLNGLFGHKPTGGICPNLGTHLDEFHGAVCRICQMGMVCRHAEDLLLLLKIMAGPPDPKEDPLAYEYRPCPVWHGKDVDLGSLTVGCLSFRGGWPTSAMEVLISSIGKGQSLAVERAVEWLRAQGATIHPLYLEDLEVGQWFESWSTRVQGAGTARFREVLCQSKRTFGLAEILRYLMGLSPHTLPALGLAFLEDAVEMISPSMEKRLLQAQEVEQLLRQSFQRCQVLIMPTLPRPALSTLNGSMLQQRIQDDSRFVSFLTLHSSAVRSSVPQGLAWE